MAVMATMNSTGDELENRKRRLDHADGQPQDSPNKKLQLSSDSTSNNPNNININGYSNSNTHSMGPPPDPQPEEEQSPYKGLEEFRKEAIYRQMLESKRDLARAERKVLNLERGIQEMESRSGEFDKFWNMLVEDVRLLVADDAALGEHKSAFLDAIPLTLTTPDLAAFSASLQSRSTATKALLSRLVSLGPTARNPEVDQLQAKCHTLADDATSLRSQLVAHESHLNRVLSELEETTARLRRAEKVADRLRSPTVKQIEKPASLQRKEEAAEAEKMKATEMELELAQERRKEAEKGLAQGEGSANGPSANGNDNSASAAELEEFRRLAQMRSNENDDLRSEIARLRAESEALRSELNSLPEDRIRDSSIFKEMHGHVAYAQQELERMKASAEAVENENIELRENREEFQAAALAEANIQAEHLQEQFKARDNDVVRLRGQRDELTAELAERRQRENVKFAQIAEIKSLVNAKEERIVTLKSELRRMGMALAAKNGDQESFEKLKNAGGALSAKGEEWDLVKVLQERLRASEESSSDFKRQLDALSSSSSDLDLASKLSSLQATVDQFNSVFSSVSAEKGLPDGQAVSSLLETQKSQIQSLTLELAAANEATNALCEEVDKLSAAYGEMERVASGKVMDLSAMEDKVLRLTTEKSKADNKYFSAMRSKDAIENDRRVALRNVERQVKVIERYAEAEKTFAAQLSVHEKEVSILRRNLSAHAQRVAELERDVSNGRARETEAHNARTQAEERALHFGSLADEQQKEKNKQIEKIAKLEKELENAKKMAAGAGSSEKKKKNSGGDKDSTVDYLNSLLKCSSCNDNYRSRVITRCFHTFCAPCIDTRIQTRQRKCPHCAAAFSPSDVETLYLQ